MTLIMRRLIVLPVIGCCWTDGVAGMLHTPSLDTCQADLDWCEAASGTSNARHKTLPPPPDTVSWYAVFMSGAVFTLLRERIAVEHQRLEMRQVEDHSFRWSLPLHARPWCQNTLRHFFSSPQSFQVTIFVLHHSSRPSFMLKRPKPLFLTPPCLKFG